MAHRSSADFYSAVPNPGAESYPPSRSYANAPIPGSTEELSTSPPPAFLGDHDDQYPTRRSQSQQTFASQYSTGGDFSSPRPHSGAWGHDSYDVTPEGSQANLAPMQAYRDKEYAASGLGSATGAVPTLRKKHGSSGSSSRGEGTGWWSRKSSRAKKLILLAVLAAIIVIAIAVAVPAAVASNKNKKNNNVSQSNDGTEAGIPTSSTDSNVDWRTAPYGGNGSTVYMANGESFVYNNTFGGFWVSIPFNDTAKPQRDIPALNEEWDYEKHLILGVNLGGWLVLEPFIVPGMFEPFNSNSNSPTATNNAIDEWTLSQALGSNLTNAMTEHYETFITEKDFAQIAAAGLNWVRIPFGWWAIETYEGEPFLEGVAWTYLLKAFGWARKYGLRVNLDLHAVPGSQNGYNHSGKQGTINFLNGVMGIANAQRTLNIIRTVTEFISQPEYKNVVPMFSVLNEPYAATIGVDVLRHFYIESYEMMRSIGGTGKNNGPFISFHDGFVNMAQPVANGGWDGFLNGWDRVALDSHRYLCFSTPNNYGLSYQAALPCNYWAENMNTSTNTFGLTIGGEWSLAINDCGKWLNNVGNGQRYDGTYYVPGNTTAPAFAAVGSCDEWNDWENWNSTVKGGLKLVAEAHMDALRHWFFWTWKTGFSTTLGKIANPMWNYQLGLEQGWIPDDPRSALGACPSLVTSNGFSIGYTTLPAPTLAPWMTGGAGAGSITDQAMYTSFSAWPPASIGTTPVDVLPTYTQTGSIITAPPASQPTSFPSGYSSSANVGDGWIQPTDTAGFYTPVAGCSYPDPWSGVQAAIPTAACTGAAANKMKRSVVFNSTPTVTRPTPPPTPIRR
ncbi:glycoside hydrolase family 5 protein [Sporobolomyces koalae]|uniref:glycoside hydrolase family 5 protein n=1 Tax=Sporobolomyces koalae TaxID=500713 RepID=UPI0031814A89